MGDRNQLGGSPRSGTRRLTDQCDGSVNGGYCAAPKLVSRIAQLAVSVLQTGRKVLKGCGNLAQQLAAIVMLQLIGEGSHLGSSLPVVRCVVLHVRRTFSPCAPTFYCRWRFLGRARPKTQRAVVCLTNHT